MFSEILGVHGSSSYIPTIAVGPDSDNLISK